METDNYKHAPKEKQSYPKQTKNKKWERPIMKGGNTGLYYVKKQNKKQKVVSLDSLF